MVEQKLGFGNVEVTVAGPIVGARRAAWTSLLFTAGGERQLTKMGWGEERRVRHTKKSPGPVVSD